MSNWKNYEDQIKPCRCGCGREVSIANKGVGKDYATDACLQKATDIAAKQLADDSGLPTEADNIKRSTQSVFDDREHRLAQLRQKRAKSEMLGNEHDANRIGDMIRQMGGQI